MQCSGLMLLVFALTVAVFVFSLCEIVYPARCEREIRRRLERSQEIEEKLRQEMRRMRLELAEAWTAHYMQVNSLRREIKNLKGRSR